MKQTKIEVTKAFLIPQELMALIGITFYVGTASGICKEIQILESGQIMIISAIGYSFKREDCDFVTVTITK